MAYLGEDIPKLGFGFMRLPESEVDGVETIDTELLCKMVDAFMEAGFTYFDTARGYHGGRSEGALKETLIDRYPRDSFQIATKLPAWAAKDADHAKSMFEKSLEETGAGFFDYYLLHNLGEHRTALFDDYGIWDFLQQKKEEGLIRNLGFSFHDKADALEQVIIDHPDIDFVQLQINYADWENKAIEARKCYEVARRHGLPVIVMEPVKGGSLVKVPKEAIQPFFDLDPDAPVASWALRFAASLEGIITVLSGMSTLEQVEENTAVMRDFKPLDAKEQEAVVAVQERIADLPTIPCTDCRYCMEFCPEHVRIPACLMSLNILTVFDDEARAAQNYLWNASSGKASKCIQCGACEGVCPQHISIIDELKCAEMAFE